MPIFIIGVFLCVTLFLCFSCRPMDLLTIKKNIESGYIKTTLEFQRDMMLMFQNAIMYNSSDHDVFQMAIEMQKEVMGHIQVSVHSCADAYISCKHLSR